MKNARSFAQLYNIRIAQYESMETFTESRPAIDFPISKLAPLHTGRPIILHRAECLQNMQIASVHVTSVLVALSTERVSQKKAWQLLEREFGLRTRLDSRWALVPLGLQDFHQAPALVLTDPGGEPLCNLPQGMLDLGDFFSVALALVSAVADMHASGLMHLNLHSANAVLSPNRRIYLTGFGKALCIPQRPAASISRIHGGSRNVVAPHTQSEQCDLHAMGEMLYQLLHGNTPPNLPGHAKSCPHISSAAKSNATGDVTVRGQLSLFFSKLLACHQCCHYDSAKSLLTDLIRCRNEWRSECTNRSLASNTTSSAYTDTRSLHQQVSSRAKTDSRTQAVVNELNESRNTLLLENARLTQALCAAQGELARVARISTMGQFAASMAHEISQPIAAIAVHAEVALNAVRQHPTQLAGAESSLRIILQAAKAAGNMIRSAKALACRSVPERAPFILDDAITEVLMLLRAELQQRGVKICTRLTLDNVLLLADRAQLQQVVMNLVLNAIDAMADTDQASKIIEVQSAIADNCGNVLISIKDEGAGIDADLAKRIFEPLFSTKPKGMGMGLAICRSIVEAHHGMIWCTPRHPAGTAFHVSLPSQHAGARPGENVQIDANIDKKTGSHAAANAYPASSRAIRSSTLELKNI